MKVTEKNGKRYNFDRVGKFNYLGVKIGNNNEEVEIMKRITKGTKSMGTLSLYVKINGYLKENKSAHLQKS